MITFPLEPAHAARLLVHVLKHMGGRGSGNFGHAGRPGEIGGSSDAQAAWEASLSEFPWPGIGHPMSDRDEIRAWSETSDLHDPKRLDALFAKAPPYTGTVYRGVSLEQLADLQDVPLKVGAEFTLPEYFSSSKLEHIGLEFARDDRGDPTANQGVLLKIHATTAVDISRLTLDRWRSQEETVLRRGSSYRVTDISGPVTHSKFQWTPTAGDPGVTHITTITLQEVTKPKTLGGKGSGNFGHAGRPGEVGGSSTELGQKISGQTWYHGTGNAITGPLKEPVFLTSNPQAADWYAKERGRDGAKSAETIIPVSLDIRHPFELKNYADAVKLKAIVERAGVSVKLTNDPKYGWSWDANLRGNGPYEGTNPIDVLYDPAVRQALVHAGYDAFYSLSDPLDDIGGAETVVPLNPREQMKGTFSKRGLGGQGSGNFGHGGRPGEVGGSTGGEFFHGTSKARLDSILKNGIQRVHAGESYQLISDKDVVYVTDNFEHAKAWAEDKYDMSGAEFAHPLDSKGDLAVLRVEIPKTVLAKIEPDRHTNITLDNAPGQQLGSTAFQYHGDIKPEWIKQVWTSEIRGAGLGETRDEWKQAKLKGLLASDTVVLYIPLILLNDLKTLGGAGSGNFDHEGRPGEVGGSGPGGGSGTDVPASTPELAAQREAGIAAIDKLVDQAVRTATYADTGTPESWSDVKQDAQDEVYEKWKEVQFDNGDIDTSGLDADVKEELQKDDNIAVETQKDVLSDLEKKFPDPEPMLPIAAPENMTPEQLKIREEMTAQGALPDHFERYKQLDPESLIWEENTGDGATLDTSALRFMDGSELTTEQQSLVEQNWDRNYSDNFDKALQKAYESDSYYERRSEIEMQQIDDAWSNMSDTERFAFAEREDIDLGSSHVSPGVPDTWLTGVDSMHNDSEDYGRTRAVANRLAELRTDEIRRERGLFEKPTYTIEDQRDRKFDERFGQSNFVIKDETGKIVSGAVTKDQAEEKARDWANEAANASSSDLIANTWSDWKGSSSSQLGLALQLASARELGGVHRLTDEEVSRVERQLGPRQMANMQAYARAQWETTQYVMSKAGEDHVEVYRGLMLPGEIVKAANTEFYTGAGQPLIPKITETGTSATTSLPFVKFDLGETHYYTEKMSNDPTSPLYQSDKDVVTLKLVDSYNGPDAYAKLPDLSLLRAGAQSTTGTRSVANTWQGVGTLPIDPMRVVLRVSAPATSVLSLPVFGSNSQEEHEAVLLGTKDKWGWDAWRNKAPDFKSQPISHVKPLKAASRMLTAKIMIDLQEIDRDRPHWMTGMIDPVILRNEMKTLGGPGSGNFGHEGRPGEVGGSSGSDYTPSTSAPVNGRWIRDDAGDAIKWEQQHDALVKDALLRWKGTSTDLRLHANDAIKGAPQPSSGSGKQTRAQAEALLWELNNKSKTNDVVLYRASGPKNPGSMTSWTESKKVANEFAQTSRKAGYGPSTIHVAEPGTIRGIRIGDYRQSGNDTEREWITAPKSLRELSAFFRAIGGPGSGNFGHAGRPGEIGGSSSDGVTVIGAPMSRAAVQDALNALPAQVRAESTATEIHAYATEAEAAEKIDAYMQKHYNITSNMTARGMVDEGKVVFAVAKPKDIYEQLSHTFDTRVSSEEWKRAAALKDRTPQQMFTEEFPKLLANLLEVSSPVTKAAEIAFKKWGWI